MTDELKSCLKSHMTEEGKDAQSYLDLAEKMEKEGYHKASKILHDISAEELTHEKYLGELLG